MENPALIQGPPSRPDATCRDANLVCCKKSPPQCNLDEGYLCLPVNVSILLYILNQKSITKSSVMK